MKCVICGAVCETGLCIRGMMICRGCEHAIMRLKPSDQAYNTYVAKLRALWGELDLS